MSTTQTSVLREFEAFQNLPEEQLNWMIGRSTLKELAAGDFLFKKGEPAEYMFMILDGQINIVVEQNGGELPLAGMGKGQITGVLPFSRLKTISGKAVAVEDSRILMLHKDHFRQMAIDCPELVQELVGVMTTRVRELTRSQQQNEKLISLGKISAGLAHELNNPAAAIMRSSSELQKLEQESTTLVKSLMAAGIKDKKAGFLCSLLERKAEAKPASMSLIEKSAIEEEIYDWLDQHESDADAETLCDWGFTTNDLDELKDMLDEEQLPVAINWLANSVAARRILSDIQDSARKIAELVASVKTYSHMDRAPVKEKMDIHQGLRSTLTMLNHKMKQSKIELQMELDQSLPQIIGSAGELNQVWTNLIDNAIDAMPAGGTLRISTERKAGELLVRIADTGTGISPDSIGHIFEPFYTTKDIGKGTGLGLDIARRIVESHQGRIEVESAPGNTVFSLYFPIT